MKILLDESVQNYISWLKDIKKAPYHTFRAYQVDLLHFLKYFLTIDKNDMPSKEEMEEYLAFIKNKYNYASYRRKVTVLRNFITYLVDSGINVHDHFMLISLPMPNIDFNLPVTYEEVISFINDLPEESLLDLRDKLIYSLIAKSGLTVKQLLALKIKDINLANNQLIISKNQLTFVDKSTVTLIENYLLRLNTESPEMPVSLEDNLISRTLKNNSGKVPLSTRSINLIIDNIGKEKGFKTRLSPTIIRRLFAKSLSEKNINKSTKEMIFGKKCRLVG